MEKTIIRQYLTLVALLRAGMGISMGMYATFLLGHGLDLLEINLVNVAFFLTLFLCEVPTGAFADVFGRKRSVVIACALYALGALIYGISSDFWGFIAAEMVCAVGSTFLTGALTAWVVDSLKHHGSTLPTNVVFSKAERLRHGVNIAAVLAGAWLFEVHASLAWFASAAFMVLAGSYALLALREAYFVPQPLSIRGGVEALRATIRVSVAYGIRNREIRFLMVLVLCINFAVMAPNMQWQPYFAQWLKGQVWIGAFGVAIFCSLMLGASCAPAFLRRVQDERKALLWCTAFIGLCLGGSGLWQALPPASALFLLHEVARGMFVPISTAYLNDMIPSKERATVLSFESIAHHLGGAVGLAASGLCALLLSISTTWVIAGAILLGCVIALTRYRK